MLDDRLLALTLMQMPFADADILGRALEADPTTIRRHLAPWQDQHLVRTVTPPNVGVSVSELYYVTPTGFRTWYPEMPLPDLIQLARTYQSDLVGLYKQLPHIPERLTLYDTILHLLDAAQSAIPDNLEWVYSRFQPRREIDDLALFPDLIYDPHIALADDHRSYHLTFSAQVAVAVTVTMGENTVMRWFSLGVWIDDGLITEETMRQRLRTVQRLHREESRGGMVQTNMVIVTSNTVRYHMWRQATLRAEIKAAGLILLVERDHGWPYLSGMTVQDAPWSTDLCFLDHRLAEADLEDVFAWPGTDVIDLAPEPPTPVVAELQRRYFAPEHAGKGLLDWLQELEQQPFVGGPVRRALYSVTLPQREHQVLVALALAPGISLTDLCTQCGLQPASLQVILGELRRRHLIAEETITAPKDRPGIPGYAGQSERMIQVCRATEVALDYLDHVYYKKLYSWHRTRKSAPIHDAGVLRCLTIIEKVLRKLEEPTYCWWQVGPRTAIRYTTTNGNESHFIVPDAHGVVVTSDGEYHRVWVEYDNATESQAQLWDKFASYVAYLESVADYEELEQYTRKWKKVQYNLLIIVPTEQREEQILDILNEVSRTKLHWRVYTMRHDQINGDWINPQICLAPYGYWDDFLGVPTPRKSHDEEASE